MIWWKMRCFLFSYRFHLRANYLIISISCNTVTLCAVDYQSMRPNMSKQWGRGSQMKLTVQLYRGYPKYKFLLPYNQLNYLVNIVISKIKVLDILTRIHPQIQILNL